MNSLIKWIVIILSLFAVQTVTYLTLGAKLLSDKLLPEYFPDSNNNFDSLIVVNPPASECNVGDGHSFIRQNLRQGEKKLIEKFNVHYVVFDTIRDQVNFDTLSNRKLVYSSWSKRLDWKSLFGFYGAIQTETLSIDKKIAYRREGTYHWILFFWIHTFEWFQSEELY